MNPKEFYKKYLRGKLNLQKAKQMISEILYLETGKDKTFFDTNSMIEIEKELGISHYGMSGSSSERRKYLPIKEKEKSLFRPIDEKALLAY